MKNKHFIKSLWLLMPLMMALCGMAPRRASAAPKNTSTALSSSANPSDSGQSVTFTATVNVVAGRYTGRHRDLQGRRHNAWRWNAP